MSSAPSSKNHKISIENIELPVFCEKIKQDVEDSLMECGKKDSRRGMFFTSSLTVFIVLLLTIRRDLNQHAVVNWLFSSVRWILCSLPNKLFSEGALSHARMRIGTKVFVKIFNKNIKKSSLVEDFHGRSTVVFDGTTASMTDTEENRAAFGRGSSQNANTGFPQLRIMAMLSIPLRKVLSIQYDSYTGKGTGERNLMKRILKSFETDSKLLFILDAGLYMFDLLHELNRSGHEVIVKVPSHLKVKRIPGGALPDGSYLAVITKKIYCKEKGKYINESVTIRMINFQIRGFRASRLVTNILDENITAIELAKHYHQRWDIEISFDEIKTHQCAVLRGHAPTTFRSKTPETVIQELYAMLIVYNHIRDIMHDSATIHNKNHLLLSFLDTLQNIIQSFTQTSTVLKKHKHTQYNYLLYLISESGIDRPKRHRINPRVVKVKSSKFKCKNDTHKSEYRNLEEDLCIIHNDT